MFGDSEDEQVNKKRIYSFYFCILEYFGPRPFGALPSVCGVRNGHCLRLSGRLYFAELLRSPLDIFGIPLLHVHQHFDRWSENKFKNCKKYGNPLGFGDYRPQPENMFAVLFLVTCGVIFTTMCKKIGEI